MNQTNWIAAYLLIGFVVYVTVKGQLSQYLQVLGLGGGTSTTPQAPASASTSSPFGIPSLPSLPTLTAPNGIPTFN